MSSKHSKSIMRLRLKKFRSYKRGYYSFLILITAYLFTFSLPFVMSDQAIVLRYNGEWYFPAFRSYFKETLGLGSTNIVPAGQVGQREVNVFPVSPKSRTQFRALQGQYENDREVYKRLTSLARRVLAKQELSIEEQEQLQLEEAERVDESGMTPLQQAQENGITSAALDNFVVMPLFPHSPYEKVDGVLISPALPSWQYPMGVDNTGRDVMTRLVYGFRISITMSLFVTSIAYIFGTIAGTILGFFGRWVDILGQRFVEIWGAIPFLYTVMILTRLFYPNFYLLSGLLAAFGWMGITYYIRGEFYREKSKDYVAAAISVGEGNLRIIFRHILPNALTPIIAFAPFAIVGTITALVSLDFLGFGLPPEEPSWGQMLGQVADSGLDNWHLIVFPILFMFFTLQLIVFIGEAVREAFDPKVFSRLR